MPTVDVRLFWISAAVLFVLGVIVERVITRRRKGRRRAMKAKLCATAGFASAAVLILPLFRWSAAEPAFGQLFSWLCVHGMIAVLLARMGFGVLRDYGKV